MGRYRDMGTFTGGVVDYTPGSARSFSVSSMKRAFRDAGTINRFTDSAISTAGAFLVSELEKRDPIVRVPLTSFTYARDIPIKIGGGWVDHTSNLNIDYGVTGGSSNGTVQASGANASPLVQMNLEKDVYNTHVFNTTMRIRFTDMMRAQVTGRSLDKMLSDGVRLVYDKHMDANVYVGLSQYGSSGLVNNPDITAATADAGVGGSTQWSSKTPQEILKDINDAINAVWRLVAMTFALCPITSSFRTSSSITLLPSPSAVCLRNRFSPTCRKTTWLPRIMSNSSLRVFLGARVLVLVRPTAWLCMSTMKTSLPSRNLRLCRAL